MSPTAILRCLRACLLMLVVVSDMAAGRSHIIAGGFARNLDIGDYSREESIWERRILSLMSPEEQERKYIAELRFFHFLRHLPPRKRPDYFLMSKLRFRFTDGRIPLTRSVMPYASTALSHLNYPAKALHATLSPDRWKGCQSSPAI